MSLVACPDCGKEVSNSARSCPNCGRLTGAPAPLKIFGLVGLLLGLFVIGSLLYILIFVIFKS